MKILKNIFCMLIVSFSFLGTVAMTSCSMKQQQETVGQYVDASVITTTVKSKILADKKLRNTTITVKTYQNTVQLSGFVNTAYQKARAELIARSVEGVTNVENALIVKK